MSNKITQYYFDLEDEEGYNRVLNCPGKFVAFSLNGYDLYMWTIGNPESREMRKYRLFDTHSEIPINAFHHATQVYDDHITMAIAKKPIAIHLYEVW